MVGSIGWFEGRIFGCLYFREGLGYGARGRIRLVFSCVRGRGC